MRRKLNVYVLAVLITVSLVYPAGVLKTTSVSGHVASLLKSRNLLDVGDTLATALNTGIGPGPVRSFQLNQISREEAIGIIRQQVLAALPGDIGALMPQRPQAPGDVLRPQYPRENQSEEESRMVFDRPTWFCFVDLHPDMTFAHPALFVFVDAATGAVTVREEQWWPVLNDARLYSTDQERLESEDRFEPPRQQGGISARRSRRLMPAAPGRHTPQRVQPVPVPIRPDVLPDRPLSSASGIRPREHIPCPRKRIDKVAVLVQGSTERIFTNNVANMKTALERAGFTVFTFRPDTDRLDEVRDFIRILGRSLDECDKFVLYVAGHGDSGSLTYGDDAWRFAAGDSESIPRSLSDDVNAGHRVLILQSCKSGGVIPHMQAAFSRAGRDQNVEVEVLTASDALQDAYAENWWFINRWTHSIYSKALSDELMSANLDLDGNGFVDVDEFDTVLRASGGIAAAAHDAYGIGQGEPAPNGQVGQLVPVEAVRLDQPLVDPGTGQTRFPAGADIELSRITGGRRAAPDACDSLHLHGIGAGIIVDGTMGPFPDPNPSGCGYGRIMIVYRFVAQ